MITLTPAPADFATMNLADALKPLRGRRLQKLLIESRVILHTDHTPGAVVEMNDGDRRYWVGADGSYRKVV